MATLSNDTKILRRCVRDLVAFSALPAVWIGYDRPRIAESLADVLLSALRADFIYIRVEGRSDEEPIEVAHTRQLVNIPDRAQAISAAVAPLLKTSGSNPSPTIPNPLGNEPVRLGITRIGYEGEFGVLVAGSSRSDFPTETERLLLGVGANQATILFHRKQAEGKLRASEGRFRALVDASAQIVWTTGADGFAEEDSPSWRAFTGQTYEEWKGRGWLDILHPDDRQRTAELWQRAVEGKTPIQTEYRLRHTSGQWRWTAVRAVPVLNPDGSVREWVGMNADITEHKYAEDSLIERTRLAILSADIGVALNQPDTLPEILQRCTEVLVHHLDVAFARIWTLDEEEEMLELQASAGMYTHLDGEPSRVPVDEFKIGLIARERKPHLTNEVIDDPRINDQDWARREGMVAFAGYPLIVEDRLVGVVAMFARKPLSETTLQALASVANSIALGIEGKQAEELLQEQTEIVETINRIGQLLSAELDMQKLAQAVTDAATELTGARFGSYFYNVYNEEAGAYMLYTLSGAPSEAFAHFPMPRATDLFGPTFRGEGTICISDVKQDPRYGKNSPYYGMPPGHLPVTSYLAVPVISRTGEVLGGLFFGHPEAGVFTERAARIIEGLAAQTAIAMDNARLYQSMQQSLAERQELLNREQDARRQAEEANRAKDEFLGMLSHELRTPLSAILSWTNILARGKFDEDMLSRAVETIDRNARLQARLIEDMLDVSRIISGKLRLETEPVDLTIVINAAVDTVRSAADAKGIHLEVTLTDGGSLALGDPVRLQQVVWNLLTNAIKFTPKGGAVRVQLRRTDSYFEITVSDSGPGIDEDFLPHVFDRFRQADSTTTRKHGGLGLGLSIVHHLVELHGGTVEVDNRAERSGAVFTVTLPVMVARRSKGSPAIASDGVYQSGSGALSLIPTPALNGLKILVVDDEVDARDLLAKLLEEYGAEVKTCGSSSEALEVLAQYKPDILVSDVGMPEEDGYALIKKVRSLGPERGGRIPAVALTAYARVEDRLRALSAGFNMHVPKPVELAELAIVIESLTRRNGKENPL